jgi:4-hydroxy-4-methyl-2-oxoglutarate aldolase
MYELNPLPTQIDKSRLELLARAEPATIGHFLHTGFMDPGVRALQQDVRVSGTAVTVRVRAIG